MATDDPSAVSTKGQWMNPKLHECQWYGVRCDSRRRVIGLELGWLALDGLLPRELGLLQHLQELDVHACDLQGVLPHKLLHGLGKVEYLRLHMNGFFGALHREIRGMKSLRHLIAFGNYLGTCMRASLV